MADIDLSQNMISSPGCISATLVDSVLDGHTDNLASRSINYFHGACNPGSFIITPDLFDTQVQELASACEQKIQNDIVQFKQDN
jgi:hypothetical protein